MASLTQISITSRRVIRYGIYIIILIVIGRFVFNIGATVYRRLVPPPKPKPTTAFGKLPKLPFPQKPNPTINYALELPEGKLPEIAELTEIYAMPPFVTNIKALEDASEKANSLGFKTEGKRVVESIPNVYIFEKGSLPSKLTINIITGIFSMSYNIEEDPLILQGVPPAPEEGAQTARDLLRNAKLLAEDLKESPFTHQFLRYEATNFNSVSSLSESNLIKINLFRKGYGINDSIQSVTPDMPEANVWFIISGGRGGQIIIGEYHYFPLDATKFSTYPLKKSDQAFEELKNGKGFIANLGDNKDSATIRKVYLAYYDAGQYQEYYQPVVVFEGDNNFFAYVPAVTDEFYGK